MATAIRNQDKPQPVTLNFTSDDFTAPAALLTLFKSQINQPLAASPVRPATKQLSPQIPEKNAWGRPMPRRRKANIRRRWYASVIESVMPFVPDEDLLVIHGLLAGTLSWSPPRRRKPALVRSDDEQQPSTALTAEFILRGAPKGETFEMYKTGRPHHLTPRFMRRLWTVVYNLIPRMEWIEAKEVWAIVWGAGKKQQPVVHEFESDQADELFGGVDQRGRLRRSWTKKRRSQEPETMT
jgi:hypothetical protein